MPCPPRLPHTASRRQSLFTLAGVVALALGTAGVAWSAPLGGILPATTQLSYDVQGSAKGFAYRADATLRWQLLGERYDLQMEVKMLLLGRRLQHSQGHLDANGLVPERFLDKARKERRLQLDWAQRELRSDGHEALPLPTGTQDRLSVFLQLSRLLAGLPQAPKAGQNWTLPVASYSGATPWTFVHTGPETLELPAGTLATWKLQRSPTQANDTGVELWFAPTLHHLPVRIRLSQANGDVVDQRLSTP